MAFRISEAAKRKAWVDQQAAMKDRTARLRARIAAKVQAEGPDSLWAEMLAEHDARHASDTL